MTMRYTRVVLRLAGLAMALLLAACGGGGASTSTSGDVVPFVRAAAAAVGLDRFLLYPNPVVLADNTYQVGEAEYAVAYYEAVDPGNDRDTLAKFKAFNSIGVTTGGHTEVNVIVGDQRDLGYGRKMTAHRKPDGTLAFVVENYLVGAYGGYSPLNLEAAIKDVGQWHLGTNAIEFSPGPLAGSDGRPANGSFVKFYTYDPTTGARLNTISLDGRPAKAMPTVCTSCHGGRGDPLTPPDATGKKLFSLVVNAYSQHRGDVQARLHPFETASLDYSTTIPGFSRVEQEAAIKEINKMVLCSFPLPTGTVPTLAEDLCRRVATPHEYQGSAAAHLKDMYGGDTLPMAMSKTVDNYVQASWSAAGQDDLYLNVQAQACRVCHLLRGTGHQADISFETFPQFDSYKDRIKAHIVDRGNMPLAKLIYDKFHSTLGMLQTMATYLKSVTLGGAFADGDLLPERPIADPGPDRVVLQGATTLSAAMSLYSTSYQWSIVSGPGAATLTNPTSATPVFTAPAIGTYVLRLLASSATATSVPAQLTIEVKTAGTLVDSQGKPYTPQLLRFADIKDTLQHGLGNCASCHRPNGNGIVIPPVWYESYDRAGTGAGTENSGTNDHWFYTELRGRVNLTDWIASPLLRKPSGNHHNGGQRSGFDTSLAPGAAGREDYDKFVSWIVNGAPE
jgi:mono/diheme cytochrome c family protein